jgi:biopolymer transport protein ExbD
MSSRRFQRYRSKEPIAEINVVPLVDVMLVLLVVFMVTAPLLTHAVKIDLPKVSSNVNINKREHIEFGIRETGEMFWDGTPITLAELPRRFTIEAAKEPQPEVHIRADRQVHYEAIAKVMAASAQAGLVRIGFVSLPNE